MSRKPLSDLEHSLRGTRPTRAKPVEPSKVPAGRPKMPTHLSEAAQKEWRRILPILTERSTLSRADSTALGIYCEQYARWVAAKHQVETEGATITSVVLDAKGNPHSTTKLHPALKIVDQCEKSLRNLMREFGCTPQSRESIKPAREPEPPAGTTVFDLLNKGKS